MKIGGFKDGIVELLSHILSCYSGFSIYLLLGARHNPQRAQEGVHADQFRLLRLQDGSQRLRAKTLKRELTTSGAKNAGQVLAHLPYTALCHNFKPLPHCDHRIIGVRGRIAAYMMQLYGQKMSHLDADLLQDSLYIVGSPLSTPYSLDDRQFPRP